MLKRSVLLVICAAILGAPALIAQQGQTGGQSQTAQKPPEAQPTPVPTPPPPPRAFGQLVAVRIDLTISDQVGSAAPVKKVMTMIAADGERASVRSINRASGNPTAQFNVDARPILVQDKIRLDLTINYEPPEIASPAADKQPAWSTTLMESMGVIVQNGVATTISQSADPRTDRKVSVEVRATILK